RPSHLGNRPEADGGRRRARGGGVRRASAPGGVSAPQVPRADDSQRAAARRHGQIRPQVWSAPRGCRGAAHTPMTGLFMTIPAGAFLMGSGTGQDDERPVHRVHVDAFEMSACPVTRAEYAAFLDATGHEHPRDWHDAAFAGDDRPVVGVSWLDAM